MGQKNQALTLLRRRIAVYDQQASAAISKLMQAQREHDDATRAIRRALGITEVHEYAPGFDSYDVLAQITPDGEHWMWGGPTNDRGTPACHPYTVPGTSVRRYRGASSVIHQIVRGVQHQKAYQPQCGNRSCVRPSHRCGSCHTEAHQR